MTIPYVIYYKIGSGKEDSLLTTLKDISESHFLKISNSLLIIDSKLSANEIYDKVKYFAELDGKPNNNQLLISEATKNMQGWLSDKEWNEIDNEIF